MNSEHEEKPLDVRKTQIIALTVIAVCTLALYAVVVIKGGGLPDMTIIKDLITGTKEA